MMSHHDKGDSPPSYTDSLAHQQPPHDAQTYSPSPSRTQPFLAQLSQTRTSHIHSIIANHILPIIEHQASFGIAQTTIALLPSDIPLPAVEEKPEFSFDNADTKPVEVIGFSNEEEPKIVRLEGQMNRTEFWRVQAVVDELEAVLGDRLNESEVLRSADSPMRDGARGLKRQRQPKRSFFNRIMPSTGPEQRSPSGNPEVGVRRTESSAGTVLVNARLEEIRLRTVNEFGLYDTISRQCVIVKVDAKC